MGRSNRRGRILEDLVALIHQIPGIEATPRVRVPPVSGDGNEREVDVLLRYQIADCPVDVVIECKNHKNPIDIELIDAFVGKLVDIGVPNERAIFVAVNGYRAGAKRRADEAGIRLCRFEGLTADRLKKEIHDALKSIIYLIPTWISMSTFPCVPAPTSPYGDAQGELRDTDRDEVDGFLTACWRVWLEGKLPLKAGEYTVHLSRPGDLSACIVDLHVIALVATVTGSGSAMILTYTSTDQVRAARVEAEFVPPNGNVQLKPFLDEESLAEQEGTAPIHVRRRIQVPRILHGKMYWPPSLASIENIQALQAAGEEITFDKVEGRNILKAFELELRRRRP